MTEMSKNRFRQGNIGESVKVKIPDVDRARVNSDVFLA